MFNGLKDELFSEEWCNIIFEKRNKEYGAYYLRATAPRRYRYAFIGVAIFFIFVIVLILAPSAVQYVMTHSFDDEEPLMKIKPLEAEKDHEYKAIAAGRTALPRPENDGPDASLAVPEIVDAVSPKLDYGLEGPEILKTPDDIFVRIPDSLVNQDRLDLPEEGPLLTPTEIVEQMPQFPGGIKALMEFIDENLVYPQTALQTELFGEVEVAFIVDKDGSVRDPQITKKGKVEFERAAINVVRLLPKWIPGKVNGQAAMVKVRVPIHFDFEEIE